MSTLISRHEAILEYLDKYYSADNPFNLPEIDIKTKPLLIKYLMDASPLILEYGNEIKRISSEIEHQQHNVKSRIEDIYDRFIHIVDDQLLKATEAPEKSKKRRRTDNMAAGDLENYPCIRDDCRGVGAYDVGSNSIVCEECSVVILNKVVFNDRAHMIYGDEVTQKTQNRYDSLEQFMKCLDNAEGNMHKDPPADVVDIVREDIRMRGLKKLTPQIMRGCLRRNRLPSMYNYDRRLVQIFTNTELPNFTPDIREECRKMFGMYIEAYAKCPKRIKGNRKNLLSYPYVARQFMYQLGLHDYIDCFPTLKGKSNKLAYDDIWTWVCANVSGPKWRCLMSRID